MKKRILWIIGGVALVTGIFFIPDQSGSIWPSVLWASLAAVIYLGVFALVWVKELQSKTKRRAVGITLSVLVVGLGISAVISYKATNWQKENLLTIRSTIESNVAYTRVNEPLLKTLKQYREESSSGISVKEVFLSEYDSLLAGDSLLVYDTNPEETLSVFLAEASADSIVLVAESHRVKGKDASFSNYSGAVGNFQTIGTLTDRGVRYERAN